MHSNNVILAAFFAFAALTVSYNDRQDGDNLFIECDVLSVLVVR